MELTNANLSACETACVSNNGTDGTCVGFTIMPAAKGKLYMHVVCFKQHYELVYVHILVSIISSSSVPASSRQTVTCNDELVSCP